MRCPACGASNPERATWCSQCYQRFAAADPAAVPAAPVPDREPVAAAARAPSPFAAVFGETLPPVPTSRRSTANGVFASVDGEVEWTCASCESANPLAELTCRTCGTPLARQFEAPRPQVDWDRAVRRELLLPGLGHALAAQRGQGYARAGLFVLWVLGALTLTFSGGLVASLPLLLGAAVLYAAGPADLSALRAGRKPRLDGRALSWLVVGVTVGLVVAGVAQAAL